MAAGQRVAGPRVAVRFLPLPKDIAHGYEAGRSVPAVARSDRFFWYSRGTRSDYRLGYKYAFGSSPLIYVS